MPNQSPERDADAPPPDGARRRELLARKWAYLFSGVVVVPLSREELDRELGDLLDGLCAALGADPVDTARAEAVGERLVALGHVGEAGLRRTMDVLGRGLPTLPQFQPPERCIERIVTGLGALACGFTAASKRVIFEQQESMQRALFKAIRDARGNLRESEDRFEQVATASASGIMILSQDGRLVRANAALGDILGRPPDALVGASVFDLVPADTAAGLREAMAALLDGGRDRVRQSQRLLRGDGDVARVSLTASLLRAGEDRPSHFVLVVEDSTELVLLQGELSRQALHDVLTGLPNRQFFGTRLESALRRADPDRGVTMYHLDIDAFAMVCDGLGRAAGEQLLVHVARRLQAVLAGEQAMIARFEGDEFGVLVENSPTTPDVATMVARITEELAEPVYVDGRGLAASASVGVVHRPPADVEPAELLRAADLALRRAKAGRRGQWELFDPEQDAADRRVQAMAVSMPGAWEQGEVVVRYRPVVRLADGRTAGVEARLRWDPPGADPVPHESCVELAERTGLILNLGEAVLRVAGGQSQWWRQRADSDLPLAVGLTAHQSVDADLSARVARVLEDTGLHPDRLMIGVPVRALSAPEAADNLEVLSHMGVHTMLDEFTFAPDDLSALEDLPVRSVRVAPRIVERHSPFVPAFGALLRASGAATIVDGVTTREQADRWREAGADMATGDLYGPARAPGEFTALL